MGRHSLVAMPRIEPGYGHLRRDQPTVAKDSRCDSAGLFGSVQCQRSTSWSRVSGSHAGNKAGETLGGFADEQKIAEEC